MTVTVRALNRTDVTAAGALLSASHADYPAFRMEFPDPDLRRRVLLPFQTAAVRDVVRHGKAVGAYLDDWLAGVALWQPPGQFPLSALRKARMTPALLSVAVAAPRAFPGFARPVPHWRMPCPRRRSGIYRRLGYIRMPSAAVSAPHCLPLAWQWWTPTTSCVICTRLIQPTLNTTGGGASSSPSPHLLPDPMVRRTTA
jgi:hypothetical protein